MYQNLASGHWESSKLATFRAWDRSSGPPFCSSKPVSNKSRHSGRKLSTGGFECGKGDVVVTTPRAARKAVRYSTLSLNKASFKFD